VDNEFEKAKRLVEALVGKNVRVFGLDPAAMCAEDTRHLAGADTFDDRLAHELGPARA
jgi:hypothetical protein